MTSKIVHNFWPKFPKESHYFEAIVLSKLLL